MGTEAGAGGTGGAAGAAGGGGAAGAGAGGAGGDFVVNDKAPPPANVAALDDRTSPLFALGDVDDDGDVDSDDQSALAGALELGKTTELGCEAAGDLNMDGALTFDDAAVLESMVAETGSVHAPMLFAQPALPCGFASMKVAATLDAMPGELAQIRLLDPTVSASEVQVMVLDQMAELAPTEDDRGFVVYPFETAVPGTLITIVLTFPTGAQLVYTLPIVEVPEKDDQLASAPPPPKIYGEEIDRAPVCPQKGNGCQALVIDFSRHIWHEFDADELVPKLQGVGCTTTYVGPRLVRQPQTIKIGLTPLGPFGPTYDIPPSAAATAAVTTANQAEWAKIKAAVAAHKQAASGKDLVFQLVNGHGGNTLCGTWGPGFWSNGSLWRDDFHEGIYKSSLQQSCGSVTHDLSCYAGLTPKALHLLNNTGADNNCQGTPGMDHTKHAAYDFDVATGTAPTTDTCSNLDVGVRVNEIGGVLDAEIAKRKSETTPPADHGRLTARFRTEAFMRAPSAYLDSGYAECTAAEHSSHY